MSFVDLGFARVDTDRRARRGFPEVIFCAGKLPEQVLSIARALLEVDGVMLGTRATAEHFEALVAEFPDARFHPVARCITVIRQPLPALAGQVAVVCAGTSDIPVAEEAAVTLETFGSTVDRISDVGVAGPKSVIDVDHRDP